MSNPFEKKQLSLLSRNSDSQMIHRATESFLYIFSHGEISLDGSPSARGAATGGIKSAAPRRDTIRPAINSGHEFGHLFSRTLGASDFFIRPGKNKRFETTITSVTMIFKNRHNYLHKYNLFL